MRRLRDRSAGIIEQRFDRRRKATTIPMGGNDDTSTFCHADIVVLYLLAFPLIWVFSGYPLLVLGSAFPHKNAGKDCLNQPFISVLAPTYNEEAVIEKRIQIYGIYSTQKRSMKSSWSTLALWMHEEYSSADLPRRWESAGHARMRGSTNG